MVSPSLSGNALFLRERVFILVSLLLAAFIVRVAYEEIPSEQKSLPAPIEKRGKESKTCRVTIYRDQPRYKLILDGKQGEPLSAYIKEESSLSEEEKSSLSKVIIKKDGQRVRLKKGACKK